MTVPPVPVPVSTISGAAGARAAAATTGQLERARVTFDRPQVVHEEVARGGPEVAVHSRVPPALLLKVPASLSVVHCGGDRIEGPSLSIAVPPALAQDAFGARHVDRAGAAVGEHAHETEIAIGRGNRHRAGIRDGPAQSVSNRGVRPLHSAAGDVERDAAGGCSAKIRQVDGARAVACKHSREVPAEDDRGVRTGIDRPGLAMGPPLPPPVSSSVPELPSIVPRSFTRKLLIAAPELAVHSRIPPA